MNHDRCESGSIRGFTVDLRAISEGVFILAQCSHPKMPGYEQSWSQYKNDVYDLTENECVTLNIWGLTMAAQLDWDTGLTAISSDMAHGAVGMISSQRHAKLHDIGITKRDLRMGVA